MKKIIIIAVVLIGILAYLNNYSLSKTNRDYNQPIIEDDVEPAQTTDETKENDKDEVIQENINDKKSYTNGETEQEATNEAERKMDDFSDESRYVSSYLCYSTYDKWSINYYYTYW